MERDPGGIIQGKATADGGKAGLPTGRASVQSEPQKAAAAPVPAHRADQGQAGGVSETEQDKDTHSRAQTPSWLSTSA